MSSVKPAYSASKTKKRQHTTTEQADISDLKRSLSLEEQAFFENLKNRWWRLNNLYYIKDKQGRKVLFRPNWAQVFIWENLWFFSIILKARQLGITTFFCVLYLDIVLFSEHKTAGIIAHKDKDARKIFTDKVKFAWDNLPEALKDKLGPPNADSAGELRFPNGSSIFVSTSTRGGTVQYLHISEFGYTCAHHPIKADEIVTGSINSVEQGCMVTIESTAEGRAGHFYELCQKAEKMMKQGMKLSMMDFKFFFFAWWQNPEYRIETGYYKPFDASLVEYFEKLKIQYNIELDDAQKKWYAQKKELNGDKMFSEYPSTPEEAFHASILGSYYATEMAKVYEQNRIREIPIDSTLRVDTWWDLGMNDKNVIIFTQTFGNEIRIVDYYENSGEGLAHYARVLQEKGYVYGRHNFPHDIKVKELGTGISRYQTLQDLRIRPIRVIERTKDLNDDIEAVRRLFPRFYFNAGKTAQLIESLENYRHEFNEATGEFLNSPKHDKYSHAADAMRVLAKGWNKHGMDSGLDGDKLISTDFF